jgi:DNA-binding MarR family transcriptional regulator
LSTQRCPDTKGITLAVQKNRRLRIADPQVDLIQRSLEDLVAVRIVSIAEVVGRSARKTFEKRFGLRNTDLRLLNFLDTPKGVTVNEIARRAHIDKAWVSRTLRHLEQSGYVVRVNDRKDSRLIVVQLTAKGRVLLEQVRALAAARETRLLDGIDKRVLKASLDRLMENAERMLSGG